MRKSEPQSAQFLNVKGLKISSKMPAVVWLCSSSSFSCHLLLQSTCTDTLKFDTQFVKKEHNFVHIKLFPKQTSYIL